MPRPDPSTRLGASAAQEEPNGNVQCQSPVRNVTLHKAECRHIRRDQLEVCGCGYTGSQDNQRWWREEHMSIEAVGVGYGWRSGCGHRRRPVHTSDWVYAARHSCFAKL